MTTLHKAAQQALEALELGYDTAKVEADRYHTAMAGFRPERHAQMDSEVQQIAAAITALRAALEEPVQEPVAWMVEGSLYASKEVAQKMGGNAYTLQALYTAPPQRKPLTEEEIDKIVAEHVRITDQNLSGAVYMAMRDLEAAHGIGGRDE